MTTERRRRHGLVRGMAVGVALALSGAIVGCHVPATVVHAAFGVDLTPTGLVAPGAVDWALHRVSGAGLRLKRAAHFSTLAFPAASAGWSVGATPGLPLTTYGCSAADFTPNGPAAAYRTDPADPLFGKLFFLTKNGKLVKVDRANPATFARWDAPAGKTFSRTFVTLSPRGARAYCLSDDGVLYIVNTTTMATAAVVAVGGGAYGIAPWVDPYRSRHDDQAERLYVATNAGAVHMYDVAGGQDGSVVSVSAATTFNVATGVTPLYGATRKIAAPPVVLNGVIYVGDMAGNFYAYDTVTPANSFTYALGEPVVTAPAIEIQDGTYSLTDPAGAPKTVATGLPVYAFVSAGATCAWLNLHDATITRSMSLRIDDNDAANFGFLKTYNFSNGGTTEYLAAEDGGNINTEAPDFDLPGTTPPAIWKNDYLTPAETNTRDDGGTPAVPLGGPVLAYVRWYSASVHPPTSILNEATLTLSPAFDQGCRVPEMRTTSAYYRDGSAPWLSNALTNANRPLISAGNAGVYLSGGISALGNVSFRAGNRYVWDVTSAFSGPAADGRYALALKHNTGADKVFWPEGPLGGATGRRARRADEVEAVKFRNNALNANPAPGAAADTRPLLTLLVSNASMPTATIETPPVIDALTKKVYVFYTNALYELDFSAPSAFSDGVAGTNYTKFNRAWHGVTANNAAGVGGRRPGGTYNNRTRFVGNFSAPVPALDLSALFVLSRSPSPDGAAPATWNYALSKISLPLNTAASTLVAGSPTFTGLAGQAALTGAAGEKEASGYLAIDPYAGVQNVYFGLSNGRVYQYDR